MNSNLTTQDYIVDNSIFRVGKVVEIIGQSVKVSVDKGKNTSSVLYKGETLQNISVGGYVKIKKGFEVMIGKIEGESVSEDKNFSQKNYTNNNQKIHRILIIKILGFMVNGQFERGIKELPLIDNTCYLITKEEFNEIHDFVDSKDEPLDIGVLEYDTSQPIKLGVNALFASHMGIFGNTGSGKSYTLAKIYRELFIKYRNNKKFQDKAKFFLIDFNGEYIDKDVIIDAKYKNVYCLTTRKKLTDIKENEKFPVNRDTLRDSVFWSIFLEATEKTQMPFINRAVKDTYLEDKLENDEVFKSLIEEKILTATAVSGNTIDKTLPTEFLYELANYMENDSIRKVADYFRLNLSGGREKYTFKLENIFFENNPDGFKELVRKQIESFTSINLQKISKIKKIGLRILIKYYDEMIRGFSNREHLAPLIKRLDKRILYLDKVLKIADESASSSKNFAIISLKDVNIEVRKMIPMLLTKELYDNKRKENKKDHSLHIIIDEAHNILSRDSDRESEQWKDYRLETFEELIKEGRKFGTFLTIASQRPSDISSTIMSQLHNYFLHRLINNNDLLAVEKTIAYLDKVSADSIPNLPTGSCILAGLIAQIPVVLRVGKIIKKANQPQSQNINLLAEWS